MEDASAVKHTPNALQAFCIVTLFDLQYCNYRVFLLLCSHTMESNMFNLPPAYINCNDQNGGLKL